MATEEKHIGTKATGYVEAKYGPFDCQRCYYFVDSISGCSHPEVMADKQMTKRHGTIPIVEPKGCCNEWFGREINKSKR